MEKTQSHARQLRRQMTEAERRFWYLLRSRRFARYKFRRQHPVGRYIIDFACCEARLAIELDGGQHMENQHYDRRRSAWLKQQGWRVIRFWNSDIRKHEEAVLEEIRRILLEILPSPRPLPERERGKTSGES